MRLIEAIVPTNGSIVRFNDEEVRVIWDENKNARNVAKHRGLPLADGLAVVINPNSKVEFDYDNRNRDERERYIGSNGDHILVVVVEWFDTGEELLNLKLISVRYAEPYEIKQMMNEDAKPANAQPETDPDNPPLTGQEKFMPAGPHVRAKLAAHKAKYAAQQADRKDAAE